MEPQVFDLLVYLVQNRDRVVSKDDLIAGIWDGRIVSESTLTSRITAVRKVVGDSGEEQRLIRTISRKGLRFVGKVTEEDAPAAPAAAPMRPALTLTGKPSIAVLPFANLSSDPEQEYFSDGITEDIITSLSRYHALFVISRSTTFTYKGPAVDIAQVARDLNVRYVLEGSVRKLGTQVRTTAQLIDAANGHHLWAAQYDRDLADVFAVQDEIVRHIIGAIAPGIMLAEIEHARRKDASQLSAWERIMRARWHIRRFTSEDVAEALRLLAEVVERDPRSSMALGDIAIASHYEAAFGWGETPAKSRARMADAARKAVEIDDSNAYGHTTLAMYELLTERHEDARRRLQHALVLDPNLAVARGYLGASYAFGGDCDAALPHLGDAIKLSPRHPLLVIWHVAGAWALMTAGHYEDALDFADRATEANPEFPDIYYVAAVCSGLLGREDSARTALAELSRRMPGLTIGDARLKRPFRRAVDQGLVLEGLRKAGMPD